MGFINNMNTVVIGDIHGRSLWKKIIEQEQPSRVIFIGDYFDSFNISGLDQIHNFKEIIEYKKLNPNVEVVMLIGNHDYHYFQGIGDRGTSGFQRNLFFSINQVIEENKTHMQLSYKMGNILFTHAGVSSVFMDCVARNIWDIRSISDMLNDVFKYRPLTFDFGKYAKEYTDETGDDIYQSPIWIRPQSLIHSNKDTQLEEKLIQIVGHTSFNEIKTIDGKYWFIDCLHSETSQYLLINSKHEIFIKNLIL